MPIAHWRLGLLQENGDTSLLDKWLKQSETSGSFHEKDNRSPEQQELIELHRRLKQLEMENGILKQAALILGRK